MNSQAQVAILAGGRSRRMGEDKNFALLDGKPLLQHVIERVSVLELPIAIIADDAEKFAPFQLPVFHDVIPNAGSLGGIYTALRYSAAAYTLCVACDMPFLNASLIAYLLHATDGADAVVPLTGSTMHSMVAVYGQACIPVIEEQIADGDLAIHRIFRRVETRFVDEATLQTLDPGLRSLVNLNTPDELEYHRR